jgi:hypothetical protein
VRKVTVTFVVGLVLVVVAVAVTLTGSPPRAVGKGVPLKAELADISSNIVICQANEVLPAGVSAVRIWMWAFFGSSVHVTAYSGSRVLTEGKRDAAWTGLSVTVPVKPVRHTTSNVTLCFALEPNSEPMLILGARAPLGELAKIVKNATPAAELAARKAQPVDGRVRIEYLAPGQGSWWSRVLSVARHIGLGHVVSGTWIALLIAALMAGVGVLAVRLTLREIR